MKEDIKCCPFCGNKVQIIQSGNEFNVYHVTTDNQCRLIEPLVFDNDCIKTREDAIREWNRRKV